MTSSALHSLSSSLYRRSRLFLQEEAHGEDEKKGFFGRLSRPFDYDTNLIPPEPNFFTAGFMMDREDR